MQVTIPAPVGMLCAGLFLTNVDDGVLIKGLRSDWSRETRNAALAVIFLRSGLELDFAVRPLRLRPHLNLRHLGSCAKNAMPGRIVRASVGPARSAFIAFQASCLSTAPAHMFQQDPADVRVLRSADPVAARWGADKASHPDADMLTARTCRFF